MSKPCVACVEHERKRRGDPPHENLQLIKDQSFRGLMTGDWEEKTYECKNCGATVHHTNDKNEFMPYWSILSSK